LGISSNSWYGVLPYTDDNIERVRRKYREEFGVSNPCKNKEGLVIDDENYGRKQVIFKI
jgi:hypothetical protein